MTDHFPLGTSWKSWHDRVVKLLTVESELGYDQKKFLHDIKTRLEQYEDKTNVSNKQLSWIRFMEDRHLEQPHVEVWPDAD